MLRAPRGARSTKARRHLPSSKVAMLNTAMEGTLASHVRTAPPPSPSPVLHYHVSWPSPVLWYTPASRRAATMCRSVPRGALAASAYSGA